MNNSIVSLEDILQAKEQRKLHQDTFRAEYKLPLISITINMPGSKKDTMDTRNLCDYAIDEITANLNVCAVQKVNLKTGPEALVAVDGDVKKIKDFCILLEERYSFSRLLDLDVFSEEGMLFSRRDTGKARNCFICGQQAVLCMRDRRHSLDELNEAVQKLIYQFRAYQTQKVDRVAAKLGALAVEAMLYEVSCTPAPGLVDRMNSGAHTDMNFYSFMSSTAALANTMGRCAQAGVNHIGDLTELLAVLRCIGIEGEYDMLKSTGGVNTQKGILFSLGIVTAAAGYLLKNSKQPTAEQIVHVVKIMTAGIVEKELKRVKDKALGKLTAGERLYVKYGVRGIRGELEDGLPSIRAKALPALSEALNKGLSINDALVQTLLILMTCVDDTTVMNRHNPEKMIVWVRSKIEDVLDKGGMYYEEGRVKTKELDNEFIKNNISPGGAADMLAVTWFIYNIEKLSGRGQKDDF